MATKTPAYIQSLVKPSQQSGPSRRVWSVDLESVWVPFFTATNVTGATTVPSEDLGAPLRLNKARDGQVRFGSNGRPQLRVAPKLNEAITDVRSNFIASLVNFTGQVIKDNKDGYAAEVGKAQKAAAPIHALMQKDVDEAIAAYEAAEAAKKADSRLVGTAVQQAQTIVTESQQEAIAA